MDGNQIPPSDAIRRGLIVYRTLRKAGNVHGALRFIIWSWPSERTTGRLKDAKQKSERTDVEAFLLGSYLAQNSEPRVSLIAYSFGARIATGALHLATGGNLRSFELTERSGQVAHRLALIAPAVENDALLPCGRHRRAVERLDCLISLYNSRDPALRFFWVTDPAEKPQALGATGLPHKLPIPTAEYDWAQTVGKEHSMMEYLDQPAIVSRIAKNISW